MDREGLRYEKRENGFVWIDDIPRAQALMDEFLRTAWPEAFDRIRQKLQAVKTNSIEFYDKPGSVLRVETTVNNPGAFKVYRPKEGDPDGPRSWREMRKGIADLHRRAEVCQAANDRCLDALGATDTSSRVGPTRGTPDAAHALAPPTRPWPAALVRGGPNPPRGHPSRRVRPQGFP